MTPAPFGCNFAYWLLNVVLCRSGGVLVGLFRRAKGVWRAVNRLSQRPCGTGCAGGDWAGVEVKPVLRVLAECRVRCWGLAAGQAAWRYSWMRTSSW